MIIPTPQDILKIMDKLKTLKRKETEFINRKLSTSSASRAAKKLTTEPVKVFEYDQGIEELIKFAVYNNFSKLSRKSKLTDDESIALLIYGTTTELTKKTIPTLPEQEQKRLLNVFLPQLRKERLNTAQKQRLQEIEYSLKHELKRKQKRVSIQEGRIADLFGELKKAEFFRPKQITYWPKKIQDLINEIDKLIFPYWDYLKENSSWKELCNYLLNLIQIGIPSCLDRVIQELDKIKYKMEVEAVQKDPEKSAETDQESLKLKTVHKKLIKAFFKILNTGRNTEITRDAVVRKTNYSVGSGNINHAYTELKKWGIITQDGQNFTPDFQHYKLNPPD